MYFVYPLFNFVSASMFGKKQKGNRNLVFNEVLSLGSNNSPNSLSNNSQRHYLTCTYFVSPSQTVRLLAEELSKKFGKSLDEIRIWIRYNEVNFIYN